MDPKTQTPPVAPVPPKSGFPVFKLILVLLFLGASATTAYLYLQNQSLKSQLSQLTQLSVEPTPTPSETPPQDPTTNWQEYNGSFFSFLYPQDWTVDKSIGVSGFDNYHYLIDLKASSYKYEVEPGTISFSYWDNPKKLDIPNFQKTIKGRPIYLSSYKQVSVGGASGYFTDNGPCEPIACKTYVLSVNDKILLIDLNEPSATQFNQIIDQILSTFKFTDQKTNTSQEKIGYIKSIKQIDDQYILGIDFIEKISGDPVVVTNKDTVITTINTATNPQITLINFDKDGKIVTSPKSISDFTELYNDSNSNIKTLPYTFKISDNKISSIAEYYLP